MVAVAEKRDSFRALLLF
jgi:hypothetical protein